MARSFVTLALLAITLTACESLGRRRARSADDLFNALPEITQSKVDSFLDELLLEDNEHVLSKREAHGDADADSDAHPQRFGVGQRRTNPAPLTASGFKEPFSLGEVVNNLYRANSWNGTWVSDTEYAYRNRDGLQLLSVVSGRSQTLVPSSEMTDVFRYWLSPDQSYVLLAIRPQKLFRHSFIAVYDIYDVRSGRRISLEPPASVVRSLGGPGPEEDAGAGGGPPPQLPLLYAEWAPVGNGIAYVFSNNIFYRPSPQGRDVVVTTSG